MFPGSWWIMYPMQFSSNSDLPTCDEATMTILRIFGSVKAFIGSRRYGVRLVRHCPGSAALRGNLRYLSAHSVTVKSSGGFIPARTLATTELRRSVLELFIVIRPICFPILPGSYPFLVFFRVVAIARQLVHNRIYFSADDFRSLRRCLRIDHIYGQPPR